MSLVFALALALQAPAPLTEREGVRWEQVSAEPTGTSYIDPASLRRTGERVRFLGKNIQRGENEGEVMLVDLELDCASAGFTLHAITMRIPVADTVQVVPLPPEAIDVDPRLDPRSPADRQLFRRICGRTLPPRSGETP